jgi:transposase-like protein
MVWYKRYEKVGSVTEVCRHFLISRKSFYKWWGLYCREGLEGLEGLRGRSKRPKSYPRAYIPPGDRAAHPVAAR